MIDVLVASSINVAVNSNMAVFVKCPQFMLAPQDYAGLLIVWCKVMLNYVFFLFQYFCSISVVFVIYVGWLLAPQGYSGQTLARLESARCLTQFALQVPLGE